MEFPDHGFPLSTSLLQIWREIESAPVLSLYADRICTKPDCFMIIISSVRATICNPVISLHFPFSHSRFPKKQKHFYCFCFQNNQPPPMPPKIIAEYAKSNRSGCKKCSQTIPAKALRLGSVIRDPRGFDSPKWYHVDCFPIGPEPIGSVESIKGFSSLKVSFSFRIFRYFFRVLFG